ncbi:helix-hairpin-helix domain-containing protein [Klebsiella aerogenes]|uniref:helix-hairpin-helix domain-containing protein n=1 Tax=Klebsiella aerogenes TaxID=548 RepID=UPI001BD245F4|nr:helix-hairpin-helix domain-containing protein [Klebsiella aerogenes]
MKGNLYTSDGSKATLGRELGKGGEGSVFDVAEFRDSVAKIYHTPPDQLKQAKLSFMAATADERLFDYIAWPQATLHDGRGGHVVGFLMPKVAGKDPIHMVYSPAHRRQHYPDAAWDFLLYVARNIAASFETVHDHGHIVGDVNQNSFMVGKDSKVVLIDSDSFQINENGRQHLCEVGVGHFTPPELQSLSSFSGFQRTANHDNFGLALLIFHVLFGGRHPYSGVPLSKEAGNALESDIAHFRYAYAVDNQQRGFCPPPRSIPVAILPDSLASMFHLAFTEKGVAAGRPTAKQWVSALDEVRQKLTKCAASAMHIFPAHLARCPWCELENQGVSYFIDLNISVRTSMGNFVMAKVVGAIAAASPPRPLNLPSPVHYQMSPRPLPKNIPGKTAITVAQFAVGIIAIVVMVITMKIYYVSQGWLWALPGGAAALWGVKPLGMRLRKAEMLQRRTAMELAKNEYQQLVLRAQLACGPEGFMAKRAALMQRKEELAGLPAAEKKELDGLHTMALEHQRNKFLATCLIASASIPGVGASRKAVLLSSGIKTAADVSKRRVKKVKGFGNHLAQAVMEWKASCERRFVFNAAEAVPTSDINAVKTKYAVRRVALEAALTEGAVELQRFSLESERRMAAMREPLQEAAKKLAQAQADFSLC